MDATATHNQPIHIVKIPGDIITCESAEEYHASAAISAISFHRLKNFYPTIVGSPAQFYMRHRQGVDLPDQDAYRVGRAAHALVLEGQQA